MEATDEERQAVWEYLLLRSVNGVLKRGDIVRTADYFRLSRFTVARIWGRGTSSMGCRVAAVVKSRKSARGSKKLDRAELCKRVAEVAVNDRENQRRVQAASGVNSYLVQQLLKEGYLRRAQRQTRPLLTPAHKLARLKYCVEHVKPGGDGDYVFDPMYDVVHMDEKWFYVKKVGQKVYVLTGKDGTPLEEPPVQYVHSKRFIQKVMFHCAVARPRGGWDGKIGLWPVVETYVTQRASVNRPAGVEELRPVSITRVISRRMLVDNVIPAIKSRWPQELKHIPIRLQQDNARPHVGENDPEVLVAGCSGGWTIKLKNQPAQRPELNCLDLGYFASIQSLQSHTRPRSTVELIDEVRRAFADTTAETLNKTFLTLQMVMRQIMQSGGWNDFRLGHMHKDKLLHSGTLPVALSCDAQTLVNAQLDIATMSALQTFYPQATAIPATAVQPTTTLVAATASNLDPFLY